MPKIINTETFIENANKVHNHLYDYSLIQYKKAISVIQIICKEHGVFEQPPYSHLRGCGCPKCAVNLRTDNIENFINKANKVHNHLYDYSLVQYINCMSKVKIICNQCGNIFEQKPNTHLNGCGCKYCQSSKGEKQIEQWLKEHNINFITQKRFDDCRNKKPLPFDFYLPELNTCIEYDGELHFSTLRIKDKERARRKLEQTKYHDSIKNKYCLEKEMRLIRISYKDKNLINILERSFLNEI